MKKKKITYGVSGMMEYQAVIKIGRSTMKVLFTDGSMNAMGMNPATYTTESLMVQSAIENSDQFKRGRIKVVSEIDLGEDVAIIRNPAKHEEPIEPTTAKGESIEPEAKDGSEQSDNSDVSDKSEQPDEPGEESGEAEVEKSTLTEMEFDNNDDAKDYLESTFGCVRSKLRNRNDIVAAGERNGVSITFS